jgi:hypothetical protein
MARHRRRHGCRNRSTLNPGHSQCDEKHMGFTSLRYHLYAKCIYRLYIQASAVKSSVVYFLESEKSE